MKTLHPGCDSLYSALLANNISILKILKLIDINQHWNRIEKKGNQLSKISKLATQCDNLSFLFFGLHFDISLEFCNFPPKLLCIDDKNKTKLIFFCKSVGKAGEMKWTFKVLFRMYYFELSKWRVKSAKLSPPHWKIKTSEKRKKKSHQTAPLHIDAYIVHTCWLWF